MGAAPIFGNTSMDWVGTGNASAIADAEDDTIPLPLSPDDSISRRCTVRGRRVRPGQIEAHMQRLKDMDAITVKTLALKKISMEVELAKEWKRHVLGDVVAAQNLCTDTFQRLQFTVRPLIEAPMVHASAWDDAVAPTFGNAQDALAHLRGATGFLDAAASFMWGAELLGLRGASHHPAHPLSAADLAAFAPEDDDEEDPVADVRAARRAAEDAYTPLLSCRGNLNSVCGLPDAQGCVDRERGFAIAALEEALRCTEICHTHISMTNESLLGL
ncbi:hypothetical protein BRADI_2g00426v3 [Brachypodium distachyon]|uniref:Uncharacterized protein n=1 Tax=Brachypodium distachyon TaxID=15368 RepID=A0A2K2D680_BRADI|nr:hypothetical protein BRADI_2g00426v3 [Brachypodium distachyon]